jgi:anti-sigma factor RsiW
MKQDCLDIGLIQAFLDGELDASKRHTVSDHVAVCDACAFMLAEAEDEAAIVFPVLEREFNTLVPTQRLWTRINSAIEIEKREAPFWQKAWAFISTAFASPSFVAAAGLLIVVGIFASLWVNRTTPETDVAGNMATSSPSRAISTASPITPPISVTTSSNDRVEQPTSVQVQRASYQPQRNSSQHVVYATMNLSNGYMPGEESYVKTIAALTETVAERKDGILRPAQRVAFERDLAVVDDAISRVKNEVKRNPRNGTARQMLYASYQNKIDLLNSVAQKEELVASIQ